MNNLEILVNEMLPLRKSGVDFFEIRKKLEEKGLSENEIQQVVKAVNDRELENLLNKQPSWVNRVSITIAVGLMIAGVVLLGYCFIIEWSIALLVLGVLIAGGGIMVLITAKSNKQRLEQMGRHTRFRKD